jgi:dolichyl-phosphate-mannose--protein O-mannosyl transferase
VVAYLALCCSLQSSFQFVNSASRRETVPGLLFSAISAVFNMFLHLTYGTPLSG